MIQSNSILLSGCAENVVPDDMTREQSVFFPNFSASTSNQLEALSAVEFVNTYLVVSFSILKTTTIKFTAKKIHSILSEPKFDSKLLEKRIESLEKCRNNRKVIADRKLNSL